MPDSSFSSTSSTWSRTEAGPQSERLSDKELRALRDRAPDAVGRHIYGSREYLRAVLRRYTDSNEQVRDLLQETFFQALRSLPKFRGDAKLSTWLYSIAKNVALGQYHKDKRRQHVEQDILTRVVESDDAGASTSGHASWDPAAKTTARERKALLHDALNKLSENYRQVIELRDLKEFSTQEAADRLDLTRVNVRVRLHRARKKLKETLGDSLVSDLQPAG
ncbi:RNA polymerase sigma-70 factor (ECF subfamily) [Salinibacter ruber]|uniref:RNA polymerase sigma factor n=1 Tax=Salinibacter ruber TaxID=146919 RepID=UPI002169FE14|nr:sigma-70 family RNA polymerase sigma factor [Salinibacter ruber]MCS3629271.1 RNA polymerase sigma-70 factor (ECF subfamily) [Salinibacter ruber]MCS4146179.1 RNA polymerase sigma-70 factor (ECF subfamily) [Salinibacter ruber]